MKLRLLMVLCCFDLAIAQKSAVPVKNTKVSSFTEEKVAADKKTAKQLADDAKKLEKTMNSATSEGLKAYEDTCLKILSTYVDEANAYIDYLKNPNVEIGTAKAKIKTDTVLNFYKAMSTLLTSAQLKGFESQAALDVMKKLYDACDAVWQMHVEAKGPQANPKKSVYFGSGMSSWHSYTYLEALEEYLADGNTTNFYKALNKIKSGANQSDLDGPPGHYFEKGK